jgi:hypothetical protein
LPERNNQNSENDTTWVVFSSDLTNLNVEICDLGPMEVNKENPYR